MDTWSPFRAYGGRKKPGLLAWPDIVVLFLLAAMLVWLVIQARKLPIYHWNWELLGQFIVIGSEQGGYRPGLLLRGLFVTLRIGFWTILVSVILGAFLGIVMSRPGGWLKFPILALVNILRSTPPLVILFCVYFFTGNLLSAAELETGVRLMPVLFQDLFFFCFAPPGQMDAMLAAVIALGTYQAAYVAEIVRGSLKAVPREQWDASRALGFSRWQTILWIIFPQALRLIIPPLTGQCISTIKESALASLISLPELTFQSLEIMAVSNMTFETWVAAGLLYLIVGLVCAGVGKALELHYSRFQLRMDK